MPAVCARIQDLSGRVEAVRISFRNALSGDCRVGRMLLDAAAAEELDAFYDQFARWSAWLWGCIGAQKEVAFGIAYEPDALTRGDAELLIEYYLTAATNGLQLTQRERADMRAELELAAEEVIVDPSTTTYSYSKCIQAPSGEGGQSGGGSSGGGSGGEAGLDGGGIGGGT